MENCKVENINLLFEAVKTIISIDQIIRDVAVVPIILVFFERGHQGAFELLFSSLLDSKTELLEPANFEKFMLEVIDYPSMKTFTPRLIKILTAMPASAYRQI